MKTRKIHEGWAYRVVTEGQEVSERHLALLICWDVVYVQRAYLGHNDPNILLGLRGVSGMFERISRGVQKIM